MKLLPFRPPSRIGPRVQPPSADTPHHRRSPVDPPPSPPREMEGPWNDPSAPLLKHVTRLDPSADESTIPAERTSFLPTEGAVSVPDRAHSEAPPVPPVTLRRGTHLDNVVPFRRRRAVRRLQRHPLVRWLQPFVQAVVLVSLPVVVTAWLWSSPRFALADVHITTGKRVPPSWVQERMGPFLHHNLLFLPLDKVHERLERHPWAASISLRKELPARLHVRIEERQEVALLRRGDELLYVDGDGRPITPFEPNGEEVNLVILSQRNEHDDPAFALEFFRELETANVPWLAGLSEIRALGQKDFKIFTTNLPFPLLVRGGTVEHKARRLNTLLPQIMARYGAGVEVDLRFARRIIVQPGPRGVEARKLGAHPRVGIS